MDYFRVFPYMFQLLTNEIKTSILPQLKHLEDPLYRTLIVQIECCGISRDHIDGVLEREKGFAMVHLFSLVFSICRLLDYETPSVINKRRHLVITTRLNYDEV